MKLYQTMMSELNERAEAGWKDLLGAEALCYLEMRAGSKPLIRLGRWYRPSIPKVRRLTRLRITNRLHSSNLRRSWLTEADPP